MHQNITYKIEYAAWTQIEKQIENSVYGVIAFPDRITDSTTNKIAAQMRLDRVS